MKKTARYEFEGIVVDIPLMYHERCDKWLEEYPDFIKNPMYTSKGMPLTLCIEDACTYAQAKDAGRLVGCSDCIYYAKAAEGTLFGYCTNEKNMKK